jgi:hypothetical protein
VHTEVTLNVMNGVTAADEPSCSLGERLVSGGGAFVGLNDDTADPDGTITASTPAQGNVASNVPTGWYVAGKNTTGATKRFVGYAICATP